MPLGVMTPLTEEAANSRRNSYGMHRISLPKLLRTAWCHFLVSCSSLQVRFLYSTLCSLLCNHRAHICGSHFSLTISSVVWIYDVPHRLMFWMLALQQVALLLEDCGASLAQAGHKEWAFEDHGQPLMLGISSLLPGLLWSKQPVPHTPITKSFTRPSSPWWTEIFRKWIVLPPLSCSLGSLS